MIDYQNKRIFYVCRVNYPELSTVEQYFDYLYVQVYLQERKEGLSFV